MSTQEAMWELYEDFGVIGAISEAGIKLENATTFEDQQYWSDVVDLLLDMEDEEQ